MDTPDPLNYGMVQIAEESDISDYERYVAWRREQQFLKEIRKDLEKTKKHQ